MEESVKSKNRRNGYFGKQIQEFKVLNIQVSF